MLAGWNTTGYSAHSYVTVVTHREMLQYTIKGIQEEL